MVAGGLRFFASPEHLQGADPVAFSRAISSVGYSPGCDWSAKFIVRPSGRVFLDRTQGNNSPLLLGPVSWAFGSDIAESPDFRDAATAFPRISIAGLILLQTDGHLPWIKGSEQRSAKHPPILLGFPDCARQYPWAARSENHFRRCESAPSPAWLARRSPSGWWGPDPGNATNASLACAYCRFLK